MAESEEEIKSLLMKVKEESEKAGFKFNIKKMEFMTSSPITSWQIEGKKVEAMTDFIFLDSKITENSDYSHEIKSLSPWKKCYDKHSVLKSRDMTLPTKIHIGKLQLFQ